MPSEIPPAPRAGSSSSRHPADPVTHNPITHNPSSTYPLGTIDGVLRPQGHVFYGWYIVLAAGGIQLFASLLLAQSFSAYVVLLEDEFGWSKTVLAGAFAMTRVESGLLGPLQGWLTDRFGPRLILQIGTTIFGVGLMLFSQMDSILTFYLTFALMAVGSSLGGFPTLMVSLVSWFNKHRSKAIAGSQMGYAIGGLLVPVIVASLERFGWRLTAFASGVVVLAICLPLAALVHHRPSDVGEDVDGTPPTPHGDAACEAQDRQHDLEAVHRSTDINFTWRQAIATPAFWFLSLGHAFALLSVSSVMVHIVPHLKEALSFSLLQAGAVISVLTAFQIAGQLIGGYLGDRYDKRWICIICMIGHTSALLLLAFATGWFMVIAFAVLHGLSWGARGPMMVALRADYFGTTAFGTIMGISSLIVMFGMAGGPIVGGLLADHFGNYVIAFSSLGMTTLLGAFCFFFARQPRSPADNPVEN